MFISLLSFHYSSEVSVAGLSPMFPNRSVSAYLPVLESVQQGKGKSEHSRLSRGTGQKLQPQCTHTLKKRVRITRPMGIIILKRVIKMAPFKYRDSTVSFEF